MSIQKEVRIVEINGTKILDTYAEAFPVWFSRIIITAATKKWAYKAAMEATGFATSKIGCPCEAGIERSLTKKETPDGRAGVSILICAEKKNMRSNVSSRISLSVFFLHPRHPPLMDFLKLNFVSLHGCTILGIPTRNNAQSVAENAGRFQSWRETMWGRSALGR